MLHFWLLRLVGILYMGAISLTFHYNIYDFYKKVLNLRYAYLFKFKIVCVFVDLKNW
jgi:hypothetical protein